MAEPGTSVNPPCAIEDRAEKRQAGKSSDPCNDWDRTKKQKVERSTSLFEHPAIVENVIPYLGIWEAFSLGSCSKYLNCVCESDCTWKLLYKRRWGQQVECSEDCQNPPFNEKRWKNAYMTKQTEWFAKITEVLLLVEQGIRDDCLDSTVFITGVYKLNVLGITYDDIYSFFFSKKLKTVFIMLGLYYAFFLFRIPGEVLKKAMAEREVIDKMVCARWTQLKTRRYGFYMPDEKFVRVYSLGTVVDKQMSILYMIRKSPHWEELRNVTISSKIPEPLKCTSQDEKE